MKNNPKSNSSMSDKTLCNLKGPFTQKNLFYSLECDGKLHTYVKSKIKWGKRPDFFFHFLHTK